MSINCLKFLNESNLSWTLPTILDYMAQPCLLHQVVKILLAISPLPNNNAKHISENLDVANDNNNNNDDDDDDGGNGFQNGANARVVVRANTMANRRLLVSYDRLSMKLLSLFRKLIVSGANINAVSEENEPLVSVLIRIAGSRPPVIMSRLAYDMLYRLLMYADRGLNLMATVWLSPDPIMEPNVQQLLRSACSVSAQFSHLTIQAIHQTYLPQYTPPEISKTIVEFLSGAIIPFLPNN